MPSPRAASSLSIVILVCCAGVGLAAIFLAQAGGRIYLSGLDYRVYLTAGRMALDGTGANFYDLPAQFATQRELWPEMTRQSQLLPFLAPPFVAVLFAPLSALPLFAGYCVLTALNVVLLWLIARGIIEELKLEGRARLAALAMLLTFAPIIFTIMQGQVSLLLVLAFWQSWRAAKNGNDWGAGVWFSLLLIRPQLAILPLLIFATKARWKLLGGFALGAAILGAISLALVGWDGLMNYQTLLAAASNWEQIYGVKPQQMQTGRGFLHALFATDHAAAIRFPWLLGIGAALAALLWHWRGAWQNQAPRFERQWAVSGLVALLCCPYLYSHDLSLLAMCGFLVFRAAQNESSPQIARLKSLPLAGYAAILLWAALLTTGANVPSVAVLFEIGAVVVLVWCDRKWKPNTLVANSRR